ncbi:FecR domain-containing protein [Parapedobacter sp. ISTM3]|uniref:FecR family protein n=1 Tax=Parapedobacter sp. ISTM3 TaxID=2800130 RepID=UPI0019043A06|nr:FecR domain-containing protein [Parapedobacter sp. ISTM3]MBK1439118.1 FecR domain-containing protein [Parapedobacter sp. ISTM3]
MDGNEEEEEIPRELRDSKQPGDDQDAAAQIGGMIARHADEKTMDKSDKERLWNSITYTVSNSAVPVRVRQYKWIGLAAGAAAIVLVTAIGLWLSRPDVQGTGDLLTQLAQAQRTDLSAMDSVRLTSSAGEVLSIGDNTVVRYRDSMLTITDSRGIQRELTLNSADIYNTLSVPYGKRTEVMLSDGTRIWLNAGSRLVFPVFFAGDSRDVYLEGEGYFDVARQGGKPFAVHLADMEVNVVGTSFNISAYADDDFSSAVLLTGEIMLTSKQRDGFRAVRLKPGKKATLSRMDQQLTLADASGEDDISWTKKQLILKSVPVHSLIRRLERVYNTAVVLADGAEAGDEKISGRLDLTQPLADVLSDIYESDIYRINQEERRIVISRKN